MSEFSNNDNNENEFKTEQENQNNDIKTDVDKVEDVNCQCDQNNICSDHNTSFGEDIHNSNNYSKINYSKISMTDSRPMSKGLKIFALVIALVILLTGTCITGYMLGKNKSSIGKKITSDLAAKPKSTDESTAAEVYNNVNQSIVGIFIYNKAGKDAQASGVIYSNDGYIVTNDHIYSEVASPKFKIYTSDGKEYEADYVAGDTVSDLAVLKIKSGTFTAATLGNSDELYFGENVVAIGRPNGASNNSSITQGIVSSVKQRVQTTSNYSSSLIQTDSAINPGNSGGALLNMYGQVVGITSSKLAGVEYDSVGYAIPTTTVKRIVEDLIENGKVTKRAKLGISYNAINSVTADIKGYDYVGLYIAAINNDSDLYGKVEVGDIITHVNGKEITSDDVILDTIEDCKAGDKITVTVKKAKGSSSDYEVTLKANVGESSYTTEEKQQSDDQNNSSSNNSSGGTFNFPFGE